MFQGSSPLREYAEKNFCCTVTVDHYLLYKNLRHIFSRQHYVRCAAASHQNENDQYKCNSRYRLDAVGEFLRLEHANSRCLTSANPSMVANPKAFSLLFPFDILPQFEVFFPQSAIFIFQSLLELVEH